MVAAYELLPSVDLEQGTELEQQHRLSFVHRLHTLSFAFDGACKIIHAYADRLDTIWLTELDRLGAPVFLCFKLLKLGLLSLCVFWGFLLVSPFWCISVISNERFLPSGLQTGLIVTLIIIIEPVPFVVFMRDARSKIYHLLHAAYLTLAWREVCIYLVPGETLGHLVARTWVRDMCFTVAGASVVGCGAAGWTLWEGLARRLWVLTTLISLLFLLITYQAYNMDNSPRTSFI